ncbi:MAG: hypothetical protein ABSF50_22380 [Burkholderiaceae bacterium]|jgi:hypothetical protein
MRRKRQGAFLAIALSASGLAWADEPPASDTDWMPHSFWVDPGVLSYHFNQHAGYRGDNWGIGGQLGFTDDLALMGGTFINSDNQRSHYFGVLWQPYDIAGIKLGGVAGGFDGYPYMHNGAWFPALLPMASYSYERVGANLTIVPNYKNRLHGALVLELLFKVW